MTLSNSGEDGAAPTLTIPIATETAAAIVAPTAPIPPALLAPLAPLDELEEEPPLDSLDSLFVSLVSSLRSSLLLFSFYLFSLLETGLSFNSSLILFLLSLKDVDSLF